MCNHRQFLHVKTLHQRRNLEHANFYFYSKNYCHGAFVDCAIEKCSFLFWTQNNIIKQKQHQQQHQHALLQMQIIKLQNEAISLFPLIL